MSEYKTCDICKFTSKRPLNVRMTPEGMRCATCYSLTESEKESRIQVQANAMKEAASAIANMGKALLNIAATINRLAKETDDGKMQS